MNAFTANIFRASEIFSVIVIILLSGCKPAPSVQIVKDLVVRHFETEKYHVIEVHIGDVKSLSPGEKTYMGTPGYLVDITSITLEIKQDIGVPVQYKKGQLATFTNCRMRIKEQPGQIEKWIITEISGIPVP